MWARAAEILLGCWLLASPFVLAHEAAALRAHDFVCGAALVAMGFLSFADRLRRAHVGTALLALWLAGLGWVETRVEPTAAGQNHLVTGLLLLLFAIVPSHAEAPTPSWRERWS